MRPGCGPPTLAYCGGACSKSNKSSWLSGRVIPCSWYCCQVCAHGRPHVGHLVLDHRVRRYRRGDSVDGVNRLDALDVGIGSAFAESAGFREIANDADRLDQRLRVVEHRFVIEAHDLALSVALRRVDLDRLHLVGELERAVGRPRLDVRCPRDQGIAVPKPDRLAVPARHVRAKARNLTFHVEGAADMDLRDEVPGDAREDLHELRRDQHLMGIDTRVHGSEIPAPHETFGPTIRRRPLRRVGNALVVEILDHSRLIFGLQQRQDRRDLVREHEGVPVLDQVHGCVEAAPVGRDRRIRVLRRTAASFRFVEQRLVVRLRSPERIRAYDGRTWVIAVAVSPGRRPRGVVSDRRRHDGPARRFETLRAVAAEVAWIAPELAVLVEVLRGEQVDRQRLDAVRDVAVPSGAEASLRYRRSRGRWWSACAARWSRD